MPGGRTAGAALLARCSFPPPGTPVDLRVLRRRRLHRPPAARPRPPAATSRAVHVDHGLRPESAAEAAAAAALAATARRAVRRRSSSTSPRGPNLEARARAARQAALPAGALTGHTADDRAETMLINLLRGAGLDGLTAMGPAPTRPLLALRRCETRALCEAAGLAPVDDPLQRRPPLRPQPRPGRAAAADGRHRRARRRRRCWSARPSVLADDAELVDAGTATIDPTDARALAAARPALARRAIRRWLAASSPSGYPPDRAAVERVRRVALGEHRACEIAGGVRVERHRQRLRIVGRWRGRVDQTVWETHGGTR